MELVRAPKTWRDDPREIARLGRWLEEQCYFRSPEERWTFVEKIARHGCDDLYEEMCREEEQERMLDEQQAFEREARWSL